MARELAELPCEPCKEQWWCHPWHKSGILSLEHILYIRLVREWLLHVVKLRESCWQIVYYNLWWVMPSNIIVCQKQWIDSLSHQSEDTWNISVSVNHKSIQEVKGKASVRYLYWKFEPLVLAISRGIMLCLCIEKNEVTVLGLIISQALVTFSDAEILGYFYI